MQDSAAHRPPADIVIGGGGLAGLALALALRHELGPDAEIVVADPAFASPNGGGAADRRHSAIAAGVRRLLERLGVWERLDGQTQPMRAMEITDSRLADALRPVFLAFDGEVEPGEPFAHMVANAALGEALMEAARDAGIACLAARVKGFEARASHVALNYDGTPGPMRTRLLCACDGARSALREAAGIGTVGWTYRQSAITVTVGHERDHEGRAIQHFLPSGPFAMLPLAGRRCAVVWTEESGAAERLVKLPAVLFRDELEQRFGLGLGAIEVLDRPNLHPLGLKVARRFVGPRLALVGDAAHAIHPIAGQGLNLGLRDVAALAEAAGDAARLGLDIGGPDVLERYQRWRRFDTLAMGAATDGLNRLFGARSDTLRLLRDVGLGLVDRLPALKGAFIRDAAGFSGTVPRLMRAAAS